MGNNQNIQNINHLNANLKSNAKLLKEKNKLEFNSKKNGINKIMQKFEPDPILDRTSDTTMNYDTEKSFYKTVNDININNNKNKEKYCELVRKFKKADYIRKEYYNKLLTKNVYEFGEPLKPNHIFIFDWDDTLFFTTYLKMNKNKDLDYNKIKKLENLVKGILESAFNKGDVYIVTNSSREVIITKCEKYYPKLMSIFEKIEIISARDLYSSLYPNNFYLWKKQALIDLINKYNTNKITNVICIGDGLSEKEASLNFIKYFKENTLKTIKFISKPSINKLYQELNLINEQLLRIFSHPKSLDIYIEKSDNN